MTAAERKKTLRARALERRRARSEEARRQDSRAVCALVADSDIFTGADCVLLYAPVRGEMDMTPLADAAVSHGMTVGYPQVTGDGHMTYRAVKDSTMLTPGVYGIPAPKDACPVLEREKIDLILVPGLCFDSKGNRLGQGGGYYDRYLEDFDGNTIGLCREDFFQINLPREPLDAFVRVVLTEEGQVWPMTQPLD